MGFAAASPFFLSQRKGRWRWPWLFVSVPAALVSLIAAFGIAAGVLYLLDSAGVGWAEVANDRFFSETYELATTPQEVVFDLLAVGLLWVPAIIGSLIHGRSIKSLVAPLNRFRWATVGKVLALQVISFTVWAVLAVLLGPQGDLKFTGFGSDTLVWFVPLVLVTLIQTSGEDVVFKGFLLRQLGAATGVAWLAPTIVIALFVSLHLGNEDMADAVWVVIPAFVFSEIIITYLTLRTGGMEAALALHWFNNVAIFLIVGEKDTQANELTLFTYDDDPTTVADDIPGMVLYVFLFALMAVAHTWRRSPFFLQPHGWQPANVDDQSTTASPPPPGAPPPLAPQQPPPRPEDGPDQGSADVGLGSA